MPKIRTIIMSVVIVYMTIMIPSTAHAQFENVASQGLSNTLDKLSKTIQQIEKAIVLVVVMQGIVTQVEHIISRDGNKITNWREYLYGAPQAAALTATHAMMVNLTRGGTNLDSLPGDADAARAGNLGIVGRKLAATETALTSLESDISLGGTDAVAYFANSSVSQSTGKLLSSVTSINAMLQPQNNTAGMIGIAQNTFAAEKERNENIVVAIQQLPGYDSANPLLMQNLQNSLTDTVLKSFGAIENPMMKTIVSSVLTKMLNRLMSNNGTAVSQLQKTIGATEGYSDYFNQDTNIGKQFQRNY